MSICVVGCANRDVVLRVATLPRAGETVVARDSQLGVGGKGVNQAVAAARAGAHTTFVGVIGDDAAEVLSTLREAGVAACVEERAGRSSTATVAIDESGENLIVVSPGATAGWTPSEDQRGVIGTADYLMVQLELGVAVAANAARRARTAGGRVVLNASPIGEDLTPLSGLVDVLIVNELEASALPVGADDRAEEEAAFAPVVVVTLGANGCRIVERERTHAVAGVGADVVDTTGAGDTFAGYLVAGLDEGLSVIEAAKLATHAASISVGRHGAAASIPSRDEVGAA